MSYSTKPPAAYWFLARLIFDPKMGLIGSSEMMVHIWTTWRYIPEDGNLSIHSKKTICIIDMDFHWLVVSNF
jgi:hypothetical protein